MRGLKNAYKSILISFPFIFLGDLFHLCIYSEFNLIDNECKVCTSNSCHHKKKKYTDLDNIGNYLFGQFVFKSMTFLSFYGSFWNMVGRDWDGCEWPSLMVSTIIG